MVSLRRTRALLAPCALFGVALTYGAHAAGAQALAPAASPSPSPAPALVRIGSVSTSDRQTEPLTATARTTYVVSKAQMLLRGDDTVAAALAGVPGVTIQSYGAAGAGASVAIRGERGDGVLVLLDGVPVPGGEIGNIDLGAMPTAGVERIEVVEGAGATLYGTGASGGVINIITSRSRAAYQTPEAAYEAGSYGLQRLAFEDATFSFAREIAANNYSYPAAGSPIDAVRTNADLSSTNARFTDGGTIGHLRIDGSTGFVSRILGVPGQLGALTSFARQQDDTQDARIGLALDRAQATTSLDLSASRQTLAYADPSLLEYGPILDFSSDARVQLSLRDNVVTNASRLIYGVDLAHGVARNDGGNGDFSAAPFAQTALYAQDSLSLGASSRIYAGLRGERDGAAGGALTPALGGVIGLGETLALKLNAGTAFQVPTAEDLTYPGFSNPYLQPERTQSFDATLEGAHVLGGASIGWFVETGTNLITLNPLVDYAQPFGPANEPLINQQQSSVAGFVLAATTKPRNGIVTNVSITDTYRALGYNDGAPAARLVGRPVFATSFDVGYTGPTWSRLAALGAVAHTVGLLDALGAGDYTSVDAYVRLRAAPHALVSLRVFDLGNERYEEIGGYPMPGRTLAVEVSTR
jgi:vitamin B12 transporter